ncbi:MAG: glycosyltransferase family 4 protein, partial [Limisphaerales bacterium]
MAFPINFYCATFVCAFATTLVTLPLWRKCCIRANLVDEPGARKIHDRPMPLAGGYAVLSGMLIPLVVGTILVKFGALKIPFSNLIVHGLERRGLELAVISAGAIGITFLGSLDDRHELKPLPKFSGQFLIAVIVAIACKRITLFVPNAAFSYAITIVWIVTVMNAFNFMDNMNGLCAGLGAIAALL